ncbi:ABC-2 transporter permease [Anaerococcus degeneri]|uniref:ABC-2 transporter permease n=1 Tax=Anaerococcus degeneri TaxID=361500 RepID=A0ABS7Z260_9FIRM|nr:ABC-2 transporter permease [Anaerococcus degeneri]MBP2014638.1 magnesium-transporting ATPase (P-type) [Anaerococcus degeneri]MCA2096851.1 ABC-2 transporter permease [Anaerococcus degeneri]
MDIRKQIKLDIISMKPYYTLKYLIIILAIFFYNSFIMKSPMGMLPMILFYAVMFSSNLFLLGENSGIDSLYKIFSIGSKKVVIARYILAGLIFIVASLLGFSIYAIVSLIKNMLIGLDMSMVIGINFVLYAIIISVQYPIFFKSGYIKAKTFKFLPIFIIAIIGMALGYFIKDFGPILNFVLENQRMLIIGLCILVVLMLTISITLSIKFYKKRDF